MGYVLKKNTNPTSRVVNRWFAYVDHQGTLTTRGLAQHMIEHGMVTNRGDVEAVLTKLSECIPELVAQGYGVKLNSIDRYHHYELHGPRPVLSPPPTPPCEGGKLKMKERSLLSQGASVLLVVEHVVLAGTAIVSSGWN
jgi:hypothetical protein